MEVSCKEKCQCCKDCKTCSGFQKILDLKDTGLIIYRHTKRIDQVDKTTENLESLINTTDDVFIIHNTKDIQVKADECITELDKEVSCPRCRELVQRAQRYLRNIPSIDKKDVISVCDHCQTKKLLTKYCCECHDVVKKFLIEKDKQSVGREEIKSWLSKIHKLLSKNLVADKTTKMKYRPHSELYLNELPRDYESSPRILEVGPMLDVGVKITDSVRSMDKVTMKSDSALGRLNSKRTKFKPSLVESVSFIEIERHESSSLATYDTSLDKDIVRIKEDLELDPFERLRQKTAIKHRESPLTLKKYYSDEKIFFSATGFEDHEDIKRNFSYVFPKEESQEIKPLRRVKTSVELIEETQDKLRLRAKLIKGEIIRQLVKRSKVSSKKQPLTETSDGQDVKTERSKESEKQYGDDLEVSSSKKEKTEDKEFRSDVDKIQKQKKVLSTDTGSPKRKIDQKKEEKVSDMVEKEKGKNNELQKERGTTDKEKKEELQTDKGKKDKEKKEELRKANENKVKERKEALQKEMEKKDKEKKEQLQKEIGKKDKEAKEELQKEIRKKDKEAKGELQKEIGKKDKETKEELQKEIGKKDKVKKDESQMKKEKNEKEKKEEMQKEKDIQEKEKQFRQRVKDEQKKPKDETLKNEGIKTHTEDDKAADNFRKLKDEQAKMKAEALNLKKQQEEENKRMRIEAEKKSNEEAERKSKTVKETKVEKKPDDGKPKHEMEQEEPASKELNIKQKKSDGEKFKSKSDKINEDNKAADNFKKMIDDQAKLKTEALNAKKQQEEENKRLRIEAEKKSRQEAEKKSKEEAEKKSKEEAERKLKAFKETKVETKPENEKPKPETKQEEPTNKELNINQIKIRKPSQDDLILQLVKIRQSSKKVERRRPKRLSEINITPLMVKEHSVHKGRKIPSCAICVDSELELDVESITNNKNKPDGVTDLVAGNKIIKSVKHPLSDKLPAEEMIPVLYKTLFTENMTPKHQKEMAEKITEKTDQKPPTALSYKYAEQELPKGIIRYALSDRSFIDKGWTMLPTEKVVRKMNVYRMRPAHPEFDWFDRNKNKRLMLYDTGEKLAEFDDNGRGRWFYRNGRLALDYYDAEEMNAQQRFVIYGSGEPDERGRYQPISILATFDYLGNGVVFDHTGKIRLKYNQTEGIVLDRGIGPVSHWKWHTLNDPPVLQQVMIDTQMAHKDPDILKLGGPADDKVRPDNEEMLAIEFDNFIKEKSKKLTQKFKPFQIRTKALKINENFSLRILDQATIYLIFRDGTTNIKMNIGMILDHQEIVDTDTAEVGEVSNNLERFPARTDSLAGLQRSVAYAQRVERLRVERQRRLKHPEKALSVDRLEAAASRPLRSQLKIVPSSSTQAKDECFCKCRKPSTSNVYYDTRLV